MMMSDQKKAYLYAASVVLIWSTVASAFKISLRYLDSLELVAFASFFSLCALFLINHIQGKLHLLATYSFRQYLHSALLGALNPFLYYLVLFKAYSLLPAQEAQPLNQTWALVLAVLSIILLKQPITIKNICALCISFIGVAIISTHGRIFDLRFTDSFGVVLALGSAWIWAVFWILSMKDTRPTETKLLLNFLFGCIYIIVVMIYAGRRYIPDWRGMIGALYTGVFEMGITFVLWLKALKLSRTTAQVSNVIYLVPFLSLIVINLTVGEIILPSTIIGLLFIIAGIIFQRYSANPLIKQQL
jgi:drug/metabolite transporter (DMT)-like permease